MSGKQVLVGLFYRAPSDCRFPADTSFGKVAWLGFRAVWLCDMKDTFRGSPSHVRVSPTLPLNAEPEFPDMQLVRLVMPLPVATACLWRRAVVAAAVDTQFDWTSRPEPAANPAVSA